MSNVDGIILTYSITDIASVDECEILYESILANCPDCKTIVLVANKVRELNYYGAELGKY